MTFSMLMTALPSATSARNFVHLIPESHVQPFVPWFGDLVIG
jgi:hypothetical protein